MFRSRILFRSGILFRSRTFPYSLAVSIVAIAVALPSASRAQETIRLDLERSTAYTEGCFPPCRCAIFTEEGVSGSLLMTPTDSDPLFQHYEVSDIEWTVPRDPPLRVSGSGTYSVGGEVAAMQRLVLDLAINDRPVERFDSGMVVGGGRFPASLDITISVNGMVCRDFVFAIRASRGESTFSRGDCNADGDADLSDAAAALGFLFTGGDRPTCMNACDANDDEELNLSDAVSLLVHLFLGGARPAAPFPGCGVDPTPGALGCASFEPCGDACRDAVEAIAEESSIVGSCSAVVRLDHDSLRLLGWQLVCGRYDQISEDEARSQSARDTGYGERGRMLNGANPEDNFVFYESPGDFGGVGVVSARTGLSVFGGSIVWDGRGDITYPGPDAEDWRSPDSLAGNCAPVDREIPVGSYDLVPGGEGIDEETVERVLDLVWQTALPEGLMTSGYLFDAIVLRYPRSVGAFDPTSAEWIVILNAGWLD